MVLSRITSGPRLLARPPAIPKPTSSPDTKEGSNIEITNSKINKDKYYIMNPQVAKYEQSNIKTIWTLGEDREITRWTKKVTTMKKYI